MPPPEAETAEVKAKPVFWTGPGNKGMSGLFKEPTRASVDQNSRPSRNGDETSGSEHEANLSRRSTRVALRDQPSMRSLNLTRAISKTGMGYLGGAPPPPPGMGDRKLTKEFTFADYDIMKDDAPKAVPPKAVAYSGLCERYNTVPCSTILRSIHTDKVVVKGRPLGPNGTLALAGALQDNRSVKRLSIPENYITNRGAEAVGLVLSGNDVLSEICLADNHIGRNGIEALCRALKDNKTVLRLDLSGNHLGDGEAVFIAELLETNMYILNLNLKNNDIRELGGEIIGLSLRSNDGLEELDLSWNHLRGRGAVAIASSMKVNISLKILNVSWNGFSTNGCIAMANALLTNSSLEQLDLTNNRVHPQGLLAIAKATLVNSTLHTLKIGMNPITPVVATEMLRLFENFPEKSALRHIQLKNVTVDYEFEQILEEIQRTRLFRIEYGAVLRKGTDIERNKEDLDPHRDPLMILFEYMKKENMRVIDLFQRLDSDGSESVTREEFKAGLLNARVPLTTAQLDLLLDKLDEDGDGEVDLATTNLSLSKGAYPRRAKSKTKGDNPRT